VTPLREPGPGDTGVPAGTGLRPYYGNLVITRPGSYDALDVHGFVTIDAPNVTISRSIIRGAFADRGRSTALITVTDNSAANFTLRDSELAPAHPSTAIRGIVGWNYTLTRVEIQHTAGAATVLGANVTIEQSWLHDNLASGDWHRSYGSSDGAAVQVLGGHGVRVTGTAIDGGGAAAVQVSQTFGPVSGLTVAGNWLDGGSCTVDVADAPMRAMSGVDVSNNQFGRTSRNWDCAIVLSAGVSMSRTGNTWAGTGQPAAVRSRG
jgi:hypothetical protein